RNIDDIADARDTRGFEAVFQPFWRRLDFHIANDARGEAAAEFGRLDFDFYGVASFGGAFRRFWRNVSQRKFVNGADFAGDAVVAEAIGAVGTDFGVDHRAMRTVFDAGDICAGERSEEHTSELQSPYDLVC